MHNPFSKQESGVSSEKYAYWGLLAFAAVVPLYVFTGANIPLLMTKVFLGGTIILIVFILFVVSRLTKMEFSFPRSLLLAVAWLIPAAYVISTIFTSQDSLNFFGERLTMDSAAFWVFSTLAMTVTVLIVNTQARALGVYLALLGSAVALSVGELILFFARNAVAKTGMIFPTLSLVGSLNDLAVFFGLITLFILLSFILLPLSNVVRGVLSAALLLAAFFLAVVNLTVVWWLVGIFALACFVYSVSAPYFSKGSAASLKLSVASLAVLILSAVFLFGGEAITGAPAQWANVGELDVRPSWTTTASIARTVLGEHMLFGSGPGSFEYIWSEKMPSEISQTAFWQTDFAFGIGLIPTMVIATGLIGALAWLVFFVVFLWSGIKALVLSRGGDQGDVASYLRITSFAGALYLWVIAIIQVPSPVLVFFASLLTGLFIAALAFGGEEVRSITLQLRGNLRVGFSVTLFFTAAVLMSIGGLFSVSTRYMAESSYQKGLRILIEEGKLDDGEALVKRAIRLNQTDTYYRLLSNIDLVRMQQLLNQGKQPDEIRQPLQELLTRALGNAQEATTLDDRDYQNWINLGSLYQSIVSLGIEGSTESAIAAFDRALALRPASPVAYLAKASLERSQGKRDEARADVEKAITLRNQYTDAIFLLAQLQLEANDTANALRSVEAVTIFEPQNPVAFFQLGLLRYGTEDYVGAAQALEKAVALNSVYANARYFLGLSYARLGNKDAALEQFKEVEKTNPENGEVSSIIGNLEAGNDPFAVATSSPPAITDLSGVPVEGANQADTAATRAPAPALSQ